MTNQNSKDRVLNLLDRMFIFEGVRGRPIEHEHMRAFAAFEHQLQVAQCLAERFLAVPHQIDSKKAAVLGQIIWELFAYRVAEPTSDITLPPTPENLKRLEAVCESIESLCASTMNSPDQNP